METILPSLYRPTKNNSAYRIKYNLKDRNPKSLLFTENDESRLDEILEKNRLENFTFRKTNSKKTD